MESSAGTPTTVDDARPAGGQGSVRLEGVSKRFGDFTAVESMDLEIDPGEFFTMLGPSGCGKTTTLRMIAGFEEPSEGSVLIDGDDVAGLPSHKRPTNTVFQSYALFPHMSVADNVAFGLKRKGVDGGETERRVSEELERVGLAREANRRPAQLSGGQQQRVALARAIVNRPRVLLLDEPLGALDLKLRKGLQLELKGIQRDVGITFVYVTHDQEEALTMSDRIAVMNHGRIEQLASPEQVYEKPVDDVRRRLHRRVEPHARDRRRGKRQRLRRQARHGRRGRRPRGRPERRRPLPRGGPPREASDRHQRHRPAGGVARG